MALQAAIFTSIAPMVEVTISSQEYARLDSKEMADLRLALSLSQAGASSRQLSRWPEWSEVLGSSSSQRELPDIRVGMQAGSSSCHRELPGLRVGMEAGSSSCHRELPGLRVGMEAGSSSCHRELPALRVGMEAGSSSCHRELPGMKLRMEAGSSSCQPDSREEDLDLEEAIARSLLENVAAKRARRS
jgi:hypothetical protein